MGPRSNTVVGNWNRRACGCIKGASEEVANYYTIAYLLPSRPVPLFVFLLGFLPAPMASRSPARGASAAHLDELVASGFMSQVTRRRCRLPSGEAEPQPRPGEVVAFCHYFRVSLDFPASAFLRAVLYRYRICLHYLSSATVMLLSVFATFCEAWLGIWPDPDILARYFSGVASSEPCPWGSSSFLLEQRRDRPFLPISLVTPACGWRDRWFYVDVSDLPRMPEFSSAGAQPSERLRWGPTLARWKRYSTVETRVEQLRAQGLSRIRIVMEIMGRRVPPLAQRERGQWEYTTPRDPARLTSVDPPAEVVEGSLPALVGPIPQEVLSSLGSLSPPYWARRPVVVGLLARIVESPCFFLLADFFLVRSWQPLFVPVPRLPLPKVRAAGHMQTALDAKRGCRKQAKADRNIRKERRKRLCAQGKEVPSGSSSSSSLGSSATSGSSGEDSDPYGAMAPDLEVAAAKGARGRSDPSVVITPPADDGRPSSSSMAALGPPAVEADALALGRPAKRPREEDFALGDAQVEKRARELAASADSDSASESAHAFEGIRPVEAPFEEEEELGFVAAG